MQTDVRLIFLMHDAQQVIIHLKSFEWDFSFGVAVLLRAGNVQVCGRQVGFGDTGGDATVIFKPEESWSHIENKLNYLKEHSDEVILERI